MKKQETATAVYLRKKKELEKIIVEEDESLSPYYGLVRLNATVMFWTILQGLLVHATRASVVYTANSRNVPGTEILVHAWQIASVNALHPSNPEQALLYKELINEAASKGLDPLDTYGIEPLQSNYHLTPTFLELYGPIDDEIRLYDAVMRAKRKGKRTTGRLPMKVIDKERYNKLKAGLRDQLRNDKVKYGKKDGRRIPLVKGGISIHEQRARVKQARIRQDKRNLLKDKNCPAHLIEQYASRRRKKEYITNDRQVLQSVRQWTQEDERKFPSPEPYVTVEGISTRQKIHKAADKLKSLLLLRRTQRQRKQGAGK